MIKKNHPMYTLRILPLLCMAIFFFETPLLQAAPINRPKDCKGMFAEQGQTAPCCPVTKQFGYLFSLKDQFLSASSASNLPGGIVLFEQISLKSKGIDTSSATTTGEIVIKQEGIYKIAFTIEAMQTDNAMSIPVSFSLFLNKEFVPGSCFATSLIQLADGSSINALQGQIILTLKAGDVLMLANTTSVPITLKSSVPYSNTPVTSASLEFFLLKPLQTLSTR